MAVLTKKKNMYINCIELFFYLAYVIYFIALFAENAMITDKMPDLVKVLKLLAIVGIGCFVFLLVRSEQLKLSIRYSRFSFMNIILIILFALLIKDMKVACFGIFIFCAQYIDVKRIIPLSFYTLLILILMVIMLYFIGFFPSVDPGIGGAEWSLRLSLGFFHYSKLPLAVMYLVFYYFIMKQKVSYSMLAFFLCINMLVVYLCGSRNAFLCTLLFLGVLFLGYIKEGRLKGIIVFFAKYGMVFCFILSLLLLVLYMLDTEIGIVLNEVFNNRIRMAENHIIQVDTIHLINAMSYDEYLSLERATQVDNSYYYILFRFGVVGILQLLGLYHIIFKKIEMNKDDIMAIAMLIFCLAIMIDGIVLNYGALTLYVYGIAHKKSM